MCAEIGTWLGEYAEQIIQVCQPAELHRIDPYKFFPEYPNSWYGGRLATFQDDMDRMYDAVRDKLEQIAGNDTKFFLHRDLSEHALPKFADEQLDWV